MSESLMQLRKNVERIDSQIVRLLQKRMLLVKEIGALKKELGLDLIDPLRETQVLQHVASLPHDPIPTSTLEGLFLQIIRTSRDLQIPSSTENPKERS